MPEVPEPVTLAPEPVEVAPEVPAPVVDPEVVPEGVAAAPLCPAAPVGVEPEAPVGVDPAAPVGVCPLAVEPPVLKVPVPVAAEPVPTVPAAVPPLTDPDVLVPVPVFPLIPVPEVVPVPEPLVPVAAPALPPPVALVPVPVVALVPALPPAVPPAPVVPVVPVVPVPPVLDEPLPDCVWARAATESAVAAIKVNIGYLSFRFMVSVLRPGLAERLSGSLPSPASGSLAAEENRASTHAECDPEVCGVRMRESFPVLWRKPCPFSS